MILEDAQWQQAGCYELDCLSVPTKSSDAYRYLEPAKFVPSPIWKTNIQPQKNIAAQGLCALLGAVRWWVWRLLGSLVAPCELPCPWSWWWWWWWWWCPVLLFGCGSAKASLSGRFINPLPENPRLLLEINLILINISRMIHKSCQIGWSQEGLL